MKIGPIDLKAPVSPASTERKDAPAAGAGKGARPEASAQVALSPAANLLAAASADPTFDQSKVDRIAQAIRDGRFEVNAEAIADKLLANAKELLGGSSAH